MHRSASLIAIAACITAGMCQSAHADWPWTTPPADTDANAESRSELWERTLHPHAATYESLIEKALATTDGRAKTDLLRRAIQLAPSKPRGHWLLGRQQERESHYKQCAKSLGKVFAIDAAYERKQLNRGLGYCLAMSGNFRAAITHYQRALAKSPSPQLLAEIAQAYMADGQLGAAIAQRQAAINSSRTGSRRGDGRDDHAMLAIAYDRAERLSLAAKHRKRARSSMRARLYTHEAGLIPEIEYAYYLGWWNKSAYPVRAAVQFREYISANTQWRGRARQHLAAIERDLATSDAPALLDVWGFTEAEQAMVKTAVRSALPALLRCVKNSPNLAIKLDLRSGETPQSRSEIVYSFDAHVPTVETTLACVDQVAEAIPMPEVKHSRRSPHASVELTATTTTP